MNREDRLLAALVRRLAAAGGPVLPGDDAARLPAGPGELAVTVDSQIAGVHHPADLAPEIAARRLLAVNLSDLAAAGAEPAWAFLALSAPPEFRRKEYLEALAEACGEHGVVLAGGDLAASPVAVATLTLIGRMPSGGVWVGRAGARAGEKVWVGGGTLGESAVGRELVARGARPAGRGSRVSLPAGLALPRGLAQAARRAVRRHLAPEPQLALGRALLRLARERPGTVGAMMDLSDGLGTDLPRLARASGVGAEVVAEALPRAEEHGEVCRALGLDPLATALGGGEDYALLFTLADGVEPPQAGCAEIGRVTGGRGLRLIVEGRRRAWPKVGWDHLAR